MAPLSRRQALRAAGSAGLLSALAGCPAPRSRGPDCGEGEVSFDPTVDDAPDATIGGLSGAWPMRRHDAAGTAATDGAGPESDVVRAWQYETPDEGGDSWVVTDGERVYLSVVDEPAVYALDPASRSVVWEYDRLESGGAAGVADGTVVVGGERGLHAVDAATGERRWVAAEETRFVSADTVVIADGTVYASGSGRVHAVDLATGEVVWRDEEPALQHLGAVADGQVLVGEPLRALDAADGSTLWRTERVNSYGDVAVRDGTAYAVGLQDVHAVDPANGEVQWSFRGNPGAYGRPAVTPEAVVVGTGTSERGGGDLYVVERESGDLRWCENLGFREVWPPAVGDGVVYVAAEDVVQARRLDDGEVLWTANGQGYRTLALAEGMLFAGAQFGRLDVLVEGG